MNPLPTTALVGMSWPIKRSFATYVAALADGDVTLGDGAAVLPQWDLVFPPADPRSTSEHASARLDFGGAVRFRGHHGMLDVTIRHPALTLSEDGTGTLDVIGPSGPFTLATVRVSLTTSADGAVSGRAEAVTLTEGGAAFFGDVYAPGDLLDPFVIHVPVRIERSADVVAGRSR